MFNTQRERTTADNKDFDRAVLGADRRIQADVRRDPGVLADHCEGRGDL